MEAMIGCILTWLLISLQLHSVMQAVPDLQLQEMRTSEEISRNFDIMLALPVGKATAERSFSLMKTRLCNRLSDDNLPRLM